MDDLHSVMDDSLGCFKSREEWLDSPYDSSFRRWRLFPENDEISWNFFNEISVNND
jgi:hypothetical protein